MSHLRTKASQWIKSTLFRVSCYFLLAFVLGIATPSSTSILIISNSLCAKFWAKNCLRFLYRFEPPADTSEQLDRPRLSWNNPKHDIFFGLSIASLYKHTWSKLIEDRRYQLSTINSQFVKMQLLCVLVNFFNSWKSKNLAKKKNKKISTNCQKNWNPGKMFSKNYFLLFKFFAFQKIFQHGCNTAMITIVDSW